MKLKLLIIHLRRTLTLKLSTETGFADANYSEMLYFKYEQNFSLNWMQA